MPTIHKDKGPRKNQTEKKPTKKLDFLTAQMKFFLSIANCTSFLSLSQFYITTFIAHFEANIVPADKFVEYF